MGEKVPREFPKPSEPQIEDFIEPLVENLKDFLSVPDFEDLLVAADAMAVPKKKRKFITEPHAVERVAPKNEEEQDDPKVDDAKVEEQDDPKVGEENKE